MTIESKSFREREKVILTGGTEGIGRAVARELSTQGHNVVICARTQSKVDAANQEGRVQAYQIDLAHTEKIEAFVRTSSEFLGGITVLILNAAVTGIRESHEYTFKVVHDAQMALVASTAEQLHLSKGRIVFITSSQAKKFVPGHEHYGQAKKDVEDWLRAFSTRPENSGIHIFSIDPGSVGTRLTEEAVKYGSEAIRTRSINAMSNGKFRDPQVVGRIISKMSLFGRKFNAESRQYDVAITNNEVLTISEENIAFEEQVSQ